MIAVRIPFHQRLVSRFVALMLLLTLVPLVTLFVISSNLTSDVLTQSLASDLEEKAFLVGADIDRFWAQREHDARLLSQADVLESENSAAIIKYLTEIIEETEFLDDIDVIDLDGIIIASSGRQNEQGESILSWQPSLETIWKRIKNSGQGDVFFSDVLMLDSGPGIALLTPVTDESNTEIVKILLVEINLATVDRIVFDFDSRVIGDKHVYLIDNHGAVISTADRSTSVLSQFPDLVVQPDLLEEFSREGAVGNIVYVDASGETVMAGYADMAEFGVNNALDWSIVAIAPMSDILQPVTELGKLILMFAGLSIVITAMLVGLFSGRLAKSISDCAVVAQKIAIGDRSALVEDPGKDEIGVLGSSINHINTNFKNVEKQLLHAQRLEAVGRLTGGVAHDFNNMLTVMIGNIEMIEDVVDPDWEANVFLEEMNKAIGQASSLTHRLLAFSGQQALSARTVDVAETIHGIENMLQRTLGETIGLEIRTNDDLWYAHVDESHLTQAIVNLAINARDAMPNGGTLVIETRNIEIEPQFSSLHDEAMPGDYVEVLVSDNGHGMDNETQARVFEPFFSTKEVGEGSGLGLSMVYGFAKQSGGHVSIYSELGHGTAVKLFLPRDTMAPYVQTEDRGDATPPRGSERILVVEDDPDVRRIPVSILQKNGYHVFEAENGKDAVAILGSGQHFDLLFTDIVLPGGMNGAEIAKNAVRLQPGIKVLFTTGYARSALVDNFQLITKPYRRADLLIKVRAVLDE